jgi:hypothetical protein
VAGDQGRGQHRGQRIPEERFRSSFGREHHFHVERARIINRAQPEFVYSGYTFELSDPWPAEWSYDDDCYIDYVDDDYYLYDAYHPGKPWLFLCHDQKQDDPRIRGQELHNPEIHNREVHGGRKLHEGRNAGSQALQLIPHILPKVCLPKTRPPSRTVWPHGRFRPKDPAPACAC